MDRRRWRQLAAVAVLGFVPGLSGTATAASLLFDNGPLSTGASSTDGTLAPAGASWSELPASNDVVGFTGSVGTGRRLADDFNVPAGGWSVGSFRFFAYKTASGTTSPFVALNLRLWDGVPGAQGSHVVFGDTTTNLLAGTAFADVYRISSATPETSRPVMFLDTLPLSLNLAAGKYWLDYQTNVTNNGSNFVPAVTIAGQRGKPGADGLLFNTTAWVAAVDDNGAPQDFPFQILGPSAVPEPSSLVLAVIGAATAGFWLCVRPRVPCLSIERLDALT